MHDVLPEELVAKIFDLLPTKQRAQIAVVCKEWRDISLRNCLAVTLKFASLEELQARRAWLDMLALHTPDALRSLQMHWQGGRLLHPAPGSLHLESFINLQKLDLKRPNNNCWVTTPKTMQGLSSLTKLEELIVSFSPSTLASSRGVGRVPDRSIGLEAFANFPKLRSLAITLHPCRGWESGWHLLLSPNFEDLLQLTQLTILGLKKVLVNPTLELVVQRLHCLNLSTRESIDEVLHAPKLRSLKYWSLDTAELPFQPSDAFRHLTFNGAILPHTVLSSSPYLTKLSFGEMLNGVTQSEIEQLSHMKDLRKLKVTGLYVESKSTNLETFTCFQRLESLHLALTGPENLHYNFSEAFRVMHQLKALKIFALTHCSLKFGGGLEHLPSLKVFHVEASFLAEPIHSASLEELHISCTGLPGTDRASYIGDLPNLCSLRLQMAMGLADMIKTIEKLRGLPRLRELSLERRMVVHWQSAQQTDEDTPTVSDASESSESSSFMEIILHQIRRLEGLEVLQFAAVNDDVSLYRSILPRVKHLRLACRGLAIDDSCMPWLESSLQLMFLKASNFTHQLLQASHDVTLTEAVSDITPYFSACKYELGEIQHEFRDDVWVECWESDAIDGHQYFPFCRMD